MRILVDEMPKHSTECELHGYNYFIEKDICTEDYMVCDLDTVKDQCRHYKGLRKPVEDDCK